MGALTLIILAIGSLIIFQSHRQQKKIKWFTEKVDLTGRIAVVTGGSSAIQELIISKCIGSLAFLQKGHFVIIYRFFVSFHLKWLK